MAGWIEAQDKVDSAGDKKGLVAKRIRMKRKELFIEIDYFRRVLRHSTTTRICKLTSEKVQLLPVPRRHSLPDSHFATERLTNCGLGGCEPLAEHKRLPSCMTTRFLLLFDGVNK